MNTEQMKQINESFFANLKYPTEPIKTDTKEIDGVGVVGKVGVNIETDAYDDRIGEALALSISYQMKTTYKVVEEEGNPTMWVGPEGPQISVLPALETKTCRLSPKEDGHALIDDPLLSRACPVMTGKWKVHATIDYLIASPVSKAPSH